MQIMNIVLLHGILGFTQIGPVNYFRGAIFANKATAYSRPPWTPRAVSPIGARPTPRPDHRRAQHRHARPTLDPAQLTHIMAHSMGGPDSRWMLSPANPDRIGVPSRSLTTIGTPHRGSPIADLVDHPVDLAPFVAALTGLGISLNGLRDLTTQLFGRRRRPERPERPAGLSVSSQVRRAVGQSGATGLIVF